MEDDMMYDKASLTNELKELRNNGVLLMLEGNPVISEEHLAELIVAEKECTYMREYVFQDNKVVEIDFGKILLDNKGSS